MRIIYAKRKRTHAPGVPIISEPAVAIPELIPDTDTDRCMRTIVGIIAIPRVPMGQVVVNHAGVPEEWGLPELTWVVGVRNRNYRSKI